MPAAATPDLDGYARYAIYYAPPEGSALDQFGQGWLGRAADGTDRPRLAAPGLPEPIEDLTAEARRYGLHGTIKAPFALADGVTPAALDAALARFAATRPAASAPRLRLSGALGFTSLRPGAPSPALDALAAGVVAEFAQYGAPLSAETLAKRRAMGLSPRQERYLRSYGYPWVLEDFHFHITLTKRLEPDAALAVRRALEAPLAAALHAPELRIDALCLFGDPGGGAPFRLLRRHSLARPRA